MTSGPAMPDLPIRWTMPGRPASKLDRVAVRITPVVWLALALLNVSRGAWTMVFFAGLLLALSLARWGEPLVTDRVYEVTYASASSVPRLLSRHGVEWPHVRLVRYAEDRIELRRHRWLSPVVLELPPDPDLRARIVAAIRTKTARYATEG